MRSTLTRSITALMLVIAMAVGMTASLGDKAQAATPINIAYAAGDGAKINGGPVYNVSAYANETTTITTVKPIKSGYEFLGWSTKKNSCVVQFKPGDRKAFNTNTTLWPVWDTKCTILSYPFESKYDDTQIHKASLESYFNKRMCSKVSITLSYVDSQDSFVRSWNNMPYEQAVVIINTHGDPSNLAPGLLHMTQMNKLIDKKIKVIILTGCNCGHYDQQQSNIARSFAERFKCVVYASDGNVYYESLMSGMGSTKTPYSNWEKYRIKNSTRKTNDGWYAYDGTSGKGKRPVLLGLKGGTTISGLISAYYAKHYSW